MSRVSALGSKFSSQACLITAAVGWTGRSRRAPFRNHCNLAKLLDLQALSRRIRTPIIARPASTRGVRGVGFSGSSPWRFRPHPHQVHPTRFTTPKVLRSPKLRIPRLHIPKLRVPQATHPGLRHPHLKGQRIYGDGARTIGLVADSKRVGARSGSVPLPPGTTRFDMPLPSCPFSPASPT
jgi:hypothetical protein